MSQLIAKEIRSTSHIPLDSGHVMRAKGIPIQMAFARSDAKTTYAFSTGTAITDLNLTITPKYTGSLLVMQWQIFCEAGNDVIFRVFRDGSLITTAGHEAYNNLAGNQTWSGIANVIYDRDNSTTPWQYFIQYAVPSTSTASVTFAPAVRQTGGGSETFYLNRSVSGTGQDDWENGVSTGTIMEIYQG